MLQLACVHDQTLSCVYPTLCHPMVTWWTVSLCDPMDCVACQAPLSLEFPRARVGCRFLLEGIFLTQESNPALLQEQMDSLALCYLGSPRYYGKKQKNI